MQLTRFAAVLVTLMACGYPEPPPVNRDGAPDDGPDPDAPTLTSFAAGSLIIPMDLAYQDRGLLQAYGLVDQLLAHGVQVSWVIDPDKTWHGAACDSVTPCPWDCAIEGSGTKCSYPTGSPDFVVSSTIVWSDIGTAAGTTLGPHGYRGGPFVIDGSRRTEALAIIDAWNDPAQWTTNPWAQRSIFNAVTVHEARAGFEANVARQLRHPTHIAVLADGNEDITTGYLRAAGLKQSSGAEFPLAKCSAGTCGPGSPNPDVLPLDGVMGPLGTCNAPDLDHSNGTLFTPQGQPAFCQVISAHWNVNDRESVQCNGGSCPLTQGQCAGETFTYHGHEAVAEVRAFLAHPTHFIAECQAVHAYENTVPDPRWPFLDDAGRDGHFLATRGTPPPCPCTELGFQCVTGGCGGTDCCLPTEYKELGAGFRIGIQPIPYQVLRPQVPSHQMDGAFQPVGGSEPAYSLSTYLRTEFKNQLEVSAITGPNGPGVDDAWISGYLDGSCDPLANPSQPCAVGRVSYLGGHRFETALPVTANPTTQGTRLLLDAVLDSDCMTAP